MTVTAEQAKAMLDADANTTRLINLAYEGGLLVELDIEARHHANSVQQLAATVVELYERLAIVEAERDRLARWKAEAKVVLAGWNQLWEDSGRPGALGESTSAATAKHINALQAAIDKVLALHACIDPDAPISRRRCACLASWPCPTVAALTQRGEG